MTTRTAIVTGAGQGMGRAIALNFAANDVHVVLVGRTASKLQSVADEIKALHGMATIAPLDVTDSEAVTALAQQLDDSTVDILVNCAGDWLIKTLDETTDKDLEHILGVNLKAPYIVSRAFLPHLRRSDNASIINIGSMTAVQSFGGVSAYTAAKTGLRGLTGSLAAELREELIRVVMVSPSPANTPMRWAASPDIDPKMLLEPETIAHIVSVVTDLPRGVTISDLLLESMLLAM
ncbi:MAG: SDR family NAD(P)-dependent oxidoreductase [Anaerolineae bacterium]